MWIRPRRKVPVAMTTTAQPRPLGSAELDLTKLFRTSPLAAAGCLCVGAANGAFWAVGAVYVQRIGYGGMGVVYKARPQDSETIVALKVLGAKCSKQDQVARTGAALTAEQEQAIVEPILAKYETEGHAYYSSARLWDDGVVDPVQTRDILGLGLAMSLNAPIPPVKFGIYRM